MKRAIIGAQAFAKGYRLSTAKRCRTLPPHLDVMPPPVTAEPKSPVPLCVDLDGTLIKTDLLWESLVLLLKRRPFLVFAVPFWLLRGRAHLKAKLAECVTINPASLPCHQAFLDFLRAENSAGRELYLVTASDARPAAEMARHFGLFREVLGSDGKVNLRGRNKGAKLAGRFGERGFDYAGNSTVDLPVWTRAREAIVVNASPALERRASRETTVGRVFPPEQSRARAFVRALRPHQWVKNVIIFVPLLTSHKIAQPGMAAAALLAFGAFCLCASGVYILNDLLDLEVDRHHATKRRRPFAAGDLPISIGLVAAPLLFGASAALACALPLRFAAALAFYAVLTTSYSMRLKQLALIDVFCLSGLYTIRLVAGHEATGIAYSFWLLVFSIFIFLSLALVKRFLELDAAQLRNQSEIKGRGYTATDRAWVAMLGIASGYLAVLVVALYVNSREVTELYDRPLRLLLICPLMLFWISRVWMIAHRGQMHEDPIVFALRDRVSYVVGALTLGVIWLATAH
jgi:4-hydroxybenzoate polyprenyltransferase